MEENRDYTIDFYDNICNCINSAKLPVSVIKYVLESVYNEITRLFNDNVKQYHEMLQKKEEAEKSEECPEE